MHDPQLSAKREREESRNDSALTTRQSIARTKSAQRSREKVNSLPSRSFVSRTPTTSLVTATSTQFETEPLRLLFFHGAFAPGTCMHLPAAFDYLGLAEASSSLPRKARNCGSFAVPAKERGSSKVPLWQRSRTASRPLDVSFH